MYVPRCVTWARHRINEIGGVQSVDESHRALQKDATTGVDLCEGKHGHGQVEPFRPHVIHKHGRLDDTIWLSGRLADHEGRYNILHYGRNRCHRVTRSVMAREIYDLILGFDFAHAMQHPLCEVTGRNAPIEAYLDAKTVLDVIGKDGRRRSDVCKYIWTL